MQLSKYKRHLLKLFHDKTYIDIAQSDQLITFTQCFYPLMLIYASSLRVQCQRVRLGPRDNLQNENEPYTSDNSSGVIEIRAFERGAKMHSNIQKIAYLFIDLHI